MRSSPAITSFGHWRPDKLRELPTHRHDGLEVITVGRGRFRWQVDGVAELVGPGMAFFTLPWQEHGAVDRWMPGCMLSFAVLPMVGSRGRPRFHPGLGLALGPREERGLFANLLAAPRHAVPATARLRASLPALVDEVYGSASDQRAQIAALATTVVLELARSIAAAPALDAVASADGRVQEFVAGLTGRCDEPWTLAGMAHACGLGRSRFTDLVERETGDSPITLLSRLRVERMRRLLRSSARPVTALALDCGFSSSQYAARVFKAFTDCTPLEWREGGERRIR